MNKSEIRQSIVTFAQKQNSRITIAEAMQVSELRPNSKGFIKIHQILFEMVDEKILRCISVAYFELINIAKETNQKEIF